MTTARLRLVFLALGLVLALPAALLVRRALASVELEREARERAVAERAFDEMERALTELLREEEARPASDYDFTRDDSPLREQPVAGLALGWFQIEADGSVSSPEWASGAAEIAARVAGEGARLEATARRRNAPASARATKPTREAPRAPLAPAPTELARALEEPRSAHEVAHATEVAAAAAPEVAIPSPTPEPLATDAFEALAKLNTGAKEREERKQRVYVEEQAVAEEIVLTARRAEAASSAEAAALPEVPAAESSGAASLSPREIVERALSADALDATTSTKAEFSTPQLEAGALGASDAAGGAEFASEGDSALRQREVVATEAAPLEEAPAAEPLPVAAQDARELARDKRDADATLAAAPTATEPASELVRVIVDPMRGRLAPSGELLLLRSAWIGDRGVRQGVVLDVRAIEAALASATLATGALPGARVALAPARELAWSGAGTAELRIFTHRFVEPFDPLAVKLSFAAFAEDGARSVYWLAALFALAGAGGLFAVYRMAAVALHFAERRSNFASAVSHELKTPLTAIRLYAEMLRDGLVSGEDKRREYYGSITAETERLSRLINNVLEFSRLERGTRTLELRIGDVGSVVREAVDLLRGHAEQHGFELALSLEDELPAVRFERDALVQVVFNLVDNAIKYGRGAQPRVEVSCRRAGEGVAIAVRDHGAGVPREELGRILEPFYRRGDELTRTAQGAGIGLALVRSLAQQMGGALRVANADGGGLIASIELSGARA
jgi:signal transduction histidine kinase